MSDVPPIPPPKREVSLGRTLWLAAEFVALFGAGPLLYYAGVFRPPLLVVLWVAGLAALAWLWRDRSFDRASLWRLSGTGRHWGPILLRWGLATAVYPLVSVSMQGVVYRSFLFHRYRDLFPAPTTMVPAAAAAFAFGHVIFQNGLAVALTAVGGVIFARTYERTRSGLLASLEHALYGNMLFTLGPGGYLVLRLSSG